MWRPLAFFLILAIDFQVEAVGHGGVCYDITLNATYACDVGLTCIYGTCSCETGQGYYYNSTSKLCEGRFQSPCNGDANCGQNMICMDMFCACASGYSHTKSRECAKAFGSVCTASEQCNQDSNLQCTPELRCRCGDENVLIFDNATQFCAAKVTQPCDPQTDYYGFPVGSSGNKCVSNAVCERNGTAGSYTCKCGEGYELVPDGTCKAVTNPGGNSASKFSAWGVIKSQFLCLAFLTFIIKCTL